jgi:glycerol-3-phosphate acyltransferase PlsY
MMDSLFSVHYTVYLMVPLAFLLGSIPFGIIFTRNLGVDIRSVGSKNIGATNVLRSVGKVPAIFTLLSDMLKGSVPVLICMFVIAKTGLPAETPEIRIRMEDFWLGITGITAVLGHMYSVFLSFKGGKGVATGFGVLLVYSPLVAGITLIVWILVAATFKYSSLAAITAITVMPIVIFVFKASSIKISIAVLLAALIIYKHKSNIINLIGGNESKIGNSN